MKTFKQTLLEKKLNENIDEIREMAYTEVQIACDNAKRILQMMEGGIEPESWNYSKITMAADYLTSVYTSMRAKESENDEYDSYAYDPFHEDTRLQEAKKILDTKNPDYHIEKTKETVMTEKHPQGAAVYDLFYNDTPIGKLVPYSGSIDKKKPGSRIVSSRKYVTLYSIRFDKDNEIPSTSMSSSAKNGHKNAKDALYTAAMYHDRLGKK